MAVYAGDSLAFPVFSLVEDGAPIDLSGWTNWQAAWSGGDNLVTLSVDDSRLAEGKIIIYADASVTRGMRCAGRWDVQAENNGVVRTWLTGTTEWTDDIAGKP